MCLAVPMQVIQLDEFDARCSVKGVERDVSLARVMDEPIGIGDWVMVYLGCVLRRISAEDARVTWELFDQMLASDEAIGSADCLVLAGGRQP